MPTRKIVDFLTEDHRSYSPLTKLLNQSSLREVWSDEVRALLPPPLDNACRVAAISGSSLVIVCDSAAVATRVRFAAPDLLPKLQALSHFAHITDVRVKVRT